MQMMDKRITATLAAALLACMFSQAAANADDIQPYHATLLTPAPRAGVDVAPHQGAMPRGLAGIWVLKVPGVAYTTSVDYGAYSREMLHVSPGAAAGYLRIGHNRRYVWYGSDGRAVSHGRLIQVVPHLDAARGATYWRVYEGSEQHYITLNADGSITVYDPGTNMVSMEGRRR